VPFRGAFYSANKQFIAPLRIRLPEQPGVREMDQLGRTLHQHAAAISLEKAAFLDWLATAIGAPLGTLARASSLAAFDSRSAAELLSVLGRSRARLAVDPTARAFVERFTLEHRSSNERLADSRRALEAFERQAEAFVFDLYELTAAQIDIVVADEPSSRD
jgi:hypothetical protein